MTKTKQDFDNWNIEKKRLHNRGSFIYAHSREIWWCALGINIGAETDGKNTNFERPILIIRVYNKETLLVLPITSQRKTDLFHFVVDVRSRKVAVKLTQARVISNKRLIRKLYVLPAAEFAMVRKAFVKYI